MTAQPLLEIEDLTVAFPHAGAEGGWAPVVRDVSLSLNPGEILGLVGESGSGKSMTAYAVLGLLPPAARRLRGRIRYRGRDLTSLPERELRAVRGGGIGMVFQEPAAALNPVLTIGYQIAEAVRLHEPIGRRAARERAVELLEAVSMPDAGQRLRSYPHELSGGQSQRALLAMALAGKPDLLLADEPTTALDVTIQAQILRLLLDLRARLGLAILLISHDLGVIAETCDDVAVMYAGQIVEVASAAELFNHPAHPYTRALLDVTPRLGAGAATSRLATIPGTLPRPEEVLPGCRFAPRCGQAFGLCGLEPPLFEARPGQLTRCFVHRPGDGGPA